MPMSLRHSLNLALLTLGLCLGGCEPAPEDTGSQPQNPGEVSPANTQNAETQAISPAQKTELLARSQAAARMLKTELKAALTQSLQSQGAVAALGVCKNMAPAIAQKAATEHQLRIRRVSLKNRNPAASPDSYEAEVLARWLTELVKNQDAPRPTFAQAVLTEVSETDGQRTGSKTVFRYLEPLYIEKGCLQCHGSQLQAEVQQSLKQLYPEDQATGYTEGDLRGAVSVSIDVPAPDSKS